MKYMLVDWLSVYGWFIDYLIGKLNVNWMFLLINSFADWLIDWLVDKTYNAWVIDCLIGILIDQLIAWPTDPWWDWSIDWLIDWLNAYLTWYLIERLKDELF